MRRSGKVLEVRKLEFVSDCLRVRTILQSFRVRYGYTNPGECKTNPFCRWDDVTAICGEALKVRVNLFTGEGSVLKVFERCLYKMGNHSFEIIQSNFVTSQFKNTPLILIVWLKIISPQN